MLEAQNLHQIRSKRMKETQKPLQDYTDSTLGHGPKFELDKSLHGQGS